MSKINFYKDKVAVNLLAGNLENAKEVSKALDGHAIIGVLSKNFKDVDSAVDYTKEFLKELGVVSVGLGAGDPAQWKMALEIAGRTNPGHVNQVFTTAPYTKGFLINRGYSDTVVNALISPTEDVNKVKITTGPYSSLGSEGVVDVEAALNMLKDTGVDSIKFFHMKGTKYLENLKVVAEASVKIGIPIIEPTGGITVDNFEQIVKVCIDAGCKKIIPHVYSSIINKETGMTEVSMVKEIFEIIKKLV